MKSLIRALLKPIGAEAKDASMASKLYYAMGLLIGLLSGWKLCSLTLTEAQLFLGLLLVICVTLLTILVGLVLELHGRLEADPGGRH